MSCILLSWEIVESEEQALKHEIDILYNCIVLNHRIRKMK